MLRDKLTTLKFSKSPWPWVLLSVVVSEVFTAGLNIVQSYARYGRISADLLVIGAIDAMFVPLIVAPVVIYFIRETRELTRINEELQREVRERKLAETSRDRSETRYRAVVEGFDGLIYLCSPDNRIEFLNERLKERIGRDATGELCHEAVHGREQPCPWCVRGQAVSGSAVRSELQDPKDRRWYAMTTTPVSNADGTVSTQVMVTDITERRLMEEEILNAGKLEATGVLAGGIAHDFNNLLTGILGNIELAKLYARQDRKASERLAEAEQATLRAKDLTLQLLTFSRGGAPVKSAVAVQDLIREVVNFSLRGSKAKSDCSIPGDLWPIEADEGQISQVLNNMIINADQAMPDGGTVRVSCGNVEVPGANAPSLPAGRYVKITIEDQGVGILLEHRSKIFDPYFTTKQRGSGLGLATSYSIIRKHHGQITVDSVPGRGSRFHIYLPASEGAVRPRETDAAALPAGQGRVLVMDDETTVQESAGNMLRVLGYEVTVAADGAEALAAYEQAKREGRPFAAVLMDLTVPGGMGGKETVRKLLEADPNAQVIVSSGYSHDPVMARYREYGFRGVLVKPYRLRELGEAVRKAIGEAP
jgi:signal transduction histidine kinase/CheY-like chemotaxis protein